MPQTRDAKGRWMQSVVAADTLTGDKVVNRQKEDLGTIEHFMIDVKKGRVAYAVLSFGGFLGMGDKLFAIPDRKSTRLNSSHLGISYAVFCLKKKKKRQTMSTAIAKCSTTNIYRS